MSDKTYYITTPIYYVNDVPHVGNASTTIAADVMARFKRAQGYRVLYMTGTDENAPKVAEAAQSRGQDPMQYVDAMASEFMEIWRRLHIEYDDFIRTTEPRHRAVVEQAFQRLLDSGDVYKDVYRGWYCVSDETFFRESEVVGGLCPNPECRRPVRWVEEENYFFRLSAYQDRLLAWIEENPDALAPEFRKNEVVSFIKAGLRDACITRQAYGWGIPVPGDPDKVIYVWFDALLNYITVAGWLSDERKMADTWPADIQLMGKDIFVRFHSTLWPAMLMGLGLEPPKRMFAHGFWTIEGEKISKSKGNAISPIKIAEDLANMSGADVDICADALRYYMLREVTFGLDGDFSLSGLIGRFNADLANDLGNLLNRTLNLLHTYRGGVVPHSNDESRETREIASFVSSTPAQVAEYLDRQQFSDALGAIWEVVGRANKYMETQAPWKLARDESCAALLDTVLYNVLETARAVAIMIRPFMPCAAQAIWDQLGIDSPLTEQKWNDAATWGLLKPGTKTTAPKPIFPRINTKVQSATGARPEAASRSVAQSPQPPTPSKEKKMEEAGYLTFDEFKKLDLRIGKIIEAEKVEGADKLLKLKVDIGTEVRPVVAGIAQWYRPEDLIGREIVVVANLAPATIRGVESRGMLLAADQEGRAILLKPDQDVPPGSKVR